MVSGWTLPHVDRDVHPPVPLTFCGFLYVIRAALVLSSNLSDSVEAQIHQFELQRS